MDKCEICGREWRESRGARDGLFHVCWKNPKPEEAPTEWTDEKAEKLEEWTHNSYSFATPLASQALVEIDRLKGELEAVRTSWDRVACQRDAAKAEVAGLKKALEESETDSGEQATIVGNLNRQLLQIQAVVNRECKGIDV